MGIDERLVELIIEAEERLELGHALTPEDLCPESPELWQTLRVMMDGLGRVNDILMLNPALDDPADLPSTRSSGVADGPDPALPRIAGFDVVAEVGRGGMGVVYEAIEKSLGRHVALKVMRHHGNSSRFRREARAAGRLHHTNIVPVFGVGEDQGRHYYAMQFIDGRGLDTLITDPGRATEEPGRAGPTSPAIRDYREVARIGVQAAEALAYAHSQGIVHRDVKPSNILLDGRGTVWITDFGLAQDTFDSETLTHSGDVLGTLRYVAPERINGHGDARGDIYSLGLTLYELLVGQPAFNEPDRARLLHQVLHHDPPRPRRLDPTIPRDLETIVLKAMARDLAHRYATAAEMAFDLRRFLEDRPIRARRAGVWERGARWCRRNPVVAGLLTSLIAVFLGGFAAVSVFWRQANTEAIRANVEARRASQTARSEAEARAAETTLRVRAQAEVAAFDFERGLDLARRGDGDLGMLWMAESLLQAPPERPAFTRVVRANLRASEARAPRLRAILDPGGLVGMAAFSPDGRLIVTVGEDRSARCWDAATGAAVGPPMIHEERVFCVAFSSDGRRIVTGDFRGNVQIWDVATCRLVGPSFDLGEPVWSVGLSPDGRLLLTYSRDCRVRIWDVATGRPVAAPLPAGPCRECQFSPDGRLVLTCGMDGRARLWEAATGRPDGPEIRHETIATARFSPDGNRIATGGDDGSAHLWDAATRRPLLALPRQGGALIRAVFSPDGRRVAFRHPDGVATIWDTASGRLVGAPVRADGIYGDAAFSPDGRSILTCTSSNSARLWDVATGRPIGSPMRHRLALRLALFSPDGALVLTVGADGSARIWEVGACEAGEPVDAPDGATRPATAAAGRSVDFGSSIFSPDGSHALLMGERGSCRLIATDSGQPVGMPIRLRWPNIQGVAFSPDGRRVTIAAHDDSFGGGGSTHGTCRIWDVSTGRPASPQLPHINWVGAIAYRPDGKLLATGDYTGTVHLWDADTGSPGGPPFLADSIVTSLAFSPDGRMLAVGTAEPALQCFLWDLADNARRATPIRFRSSVRELAFSPDGARLAAGSFDSTARLIDVATGQAVGEPLQQRGQVDRLTFSPDGRYLLITGFSQGSARVWDVNSGRPVTPAITDGTPLGDTGAFGPDSSTFAVGCEDGSARLWDVATGRPAAPPLMLRGQGIGVAFRPDGRSLVAAGGSGAVRSWALAAGPSDEPVERLADRVRARIGVELDSTREIAVLDAGAWRELRSKVDGPSVSAGPPDDADSSRHEDWARDAEALRDGYAARRHLDPLIAARPADGLLHARRARAWLWSGDARSAAADLERALTLGPRDRILDWLAQAADDFLIIEHPEHALRLLDRVVAARPDDWFGYALRAEALAGLGRPADAEADVARAVRLGADIPFLIRLAAERSRAGEWAVAASLYDRAIAMGPVPFEVWPEAATAYLEIGDEPGYRRVCAILRDRHPAEIRVGLVAAELARICVLGPGGTGDDAKAEGWIGSTVTSPSSRRYRRALRRSFLLRFGEVLFRSGRYREAIERIEEGIEVGGGSAESDDLAFLAMARFQSGDRVQARKILAEPWADGLTGPSSEAWWAGRASRLLRREAERLILDPPFPADPFAPGSEP